MQATEHRFYRIRSLSSTSKLKRMSPRSNKIQLRELALPSRLLIAVMRISGRTTAIPPLERCVLDTLGRVIDSGPERVETLVAINQLCSMISAQTRFRLDIEDKTSATLSNDESLIIKALAQLARGEIEQVHATLEWIMEKRVRNQFIGAANLLLHSHGYAMSGPSVFSTRSLCGTRADQPWTQFEPAVHHCDQLSTSELLVLQTTRLWVKGVFIGFDSGAALQYLSAHLCIGSLDIMLHNIMLETGSRAIRPFDARCLCCTEVSPDEARLLASLATLADGDVELSRHHFLKWLPESSVSHLLQAQPEFLSALHQLPEPLPRREWDFDELRMRQVKYFEKEQANGHHHLH